MSDFLEVELRPTDGKGKLHKAQRMRDGFRAWFTAGKPNLNVQFDRKQLEHILSHSGRGRNTLFEIRLNADKELEADTVMIRELQRDPVHRQLLHADFYRISMSGEDHYRGPPGDGGGSSGGKRRREAAALFAFSEDRVPASPDSQRD